MKRSAFASAIARLRRRRSDLILPFIISAALHAGLLLWWTGSSEAQILFKPGDAAVALNILPSAATSRLSYATETQPATPPQEQPEQTVALPAPEPERLPDSPSPHAAEETLQRSMEDPSIQTPIAQQDRSAPIASPVPLMSQAETEQPDALGESGDGSKAVSAGDLQEQPAPTGKQIPSGEAADTAYADSAEVIGDLREQGTTSQARVNVLSKPLYPDYSRRHGEEGRVILFVEVLAGGKPGRMGVVKSSGYARLDQAAVDSLREATYIPAKSLGKPISSTKQIAFIFRLDEPRY